MGFRGADSISATPTAKEGKTVARILIVDDQKDIQLLVSSILSQEGHKCSTANNGAEALAAIEAGDFDLVVLDVMMPKVDGYEVLKEMRAFSARSRSRVIMLTAKNQEADWARGYALGADQYLTKPFEVSELIEAVETLLSLSSEQLRAHREDELDRAKLLSRLESLLG